jgi:RNA polymerase sigma-70 factor (ECF subfamily)
MTQAEAGEFAELYATNFSHIATQLYAYLGDHAEAQDAAQEAFCRAYDRWSVVGRYEDAVAWVRRVAWNLATSRLRHLRIVARHVSRQRVEHVDGPGPDRVAVVEALALLPSQQRRAIVLHYFARLTVAEIAQQQGVSAGTVKSWLSRGRARLAEHFIEKQPSELDGVAPYLTPPGADAVAATVRRRRVARRSVLAAVVAVAVALPLTLLLLVRGAESPVIGPTPAPSISPSPSPSPGSTTVRKLSVSGLDTGGPLPAMRFADSRTIWVHHDSCERVEKRFPGCRHRLWRSTDAGVSWQAVRLPTLAHDVVLRLYPGDRDTLTIGLDPANFTETRGYLLTKDGGKTFASLPADRPPVEGQLAYRGPYSMVCPGTTSLDREWPSECNQLQLLKVGVGPVPAPLNGRDALATTAPDGRIWLVEDDEIRVSADGGASWSAAPRSPRKGNAANVLPKFSPDGREVWLLCIDRLYRLDGDRWQEQSGYLGQLEGSEILPADYGWEPLGDGALALIVDKKLVLSKGGKVTVFDRVKVEWLKALPDGSILVGEFDTNSEALAIGVGTGVDRVWTVYRT